MSIKLISLNIEGDNHYDRIFPFLEKEQPDVICLQEFFLADMPLFKHRLRMDGYAVPVASLTQPNPYRLTPKGDWGLAIFTSLAQASFSHALYKGQPDVVPEFFIGDPNSVNRAVLFASLHKEDKAYEVATTHFTWAGDGGTNEAQAMDITTLLRLVEPKENLILCGDFNAPRGQEIFSTLAARFRDNIPPDVQTTMDNSLHRVPTLKPLVVDGLFTTPQYEAHDVRVVGGVSDHKAIVATISQR